MTILDEPLACHATLREPQCYCCCWRCRSRPAPRATRHLSSEDDDAFCRQGGKVAIGSPDYVYCRKDRDAARNAAIARADRKQRGLAEYMLNNPN
jgi:hypothetical protein